MFKLPLAGTKAREAIGDVAELAHKLAARHSEIPTFGLALRNARRFMETAGKAVHSVNVVCWGNCNVASERGCIICLNVGPRGGFRRVWNFGDGRPQ